MLSERNTALDIVEFLKSEQDKDIEKFESWTGIGVDRTAFTARAINDSYCIIYPPPELTETVYRGQTKFYSNCFSSIHRGAPTALEVFIERLKAVEFELLIKKHPFVKGFANEKIENHLIRIDYEGLAQHYELKTELIDLTSDPYVAGFFATCRYNREKGEYAPVEEKDTIGVIYGYDFMLDYPSNKDKQYSHGIGLQPLPRPETQKAFSYRLRKGERFNKMNRVSIFKFYHQPSVSNTFYDMFQGGKSLFPDDLIASKAAEIRSAQVFSNPAFVLAFSRYWNNNNADSLRNKINGMKIDIVADEVINFTEKEMARLQEEWPRVRTEFRSKFKFRRVIHPEPVG